MDKRTESIVKIMQQLGADLDIPEEFIDEVPEEELLHDWDGGVIDEVK